MSLFYLANRPDDENGKHNNDFVTTFRTPFTIPPHAKVSVEGAYIPLNNIITIVTGVNSRFRIIGYAQNTPADEWVVQDDIPSGRYNEQTLCAALQQVAQLALNAVVLTPAQLLVWAPSSQWTIRVFFNEDEFNTETGSRTSNYSILINNFYIGSGSIYYNFKIILDSSIGSPNPDRGKNNLANIMGWNNGLNELGEFPNEWGYIEEDFLIPNNNPDTLKYALIEGNSTYENNGPTLAYNSTNLLVIEIPELGTQLYNSLLLDKQPAVCVIPYTQEDLTTGYVLYRPPFPLELHSANEEQQLLTRLSVRIREGDGQIAFIASTYERSYIVLRIETTQDLEKQDLHELSKEKRMAFLRNSLLHQLPK